jgi:hypothetical protein
VLDTEEVLDDASTATPDALIGAPFSFDLRYTDPDDLPLAAAVARATRSGCSTRSRAGSRSRRRSRG